MCVQATVEEADSPANQQLRSLVMIPGLEEAQKRTDQAVIEAEKFRAVVEQPAGMTGLNFDNDRISSNSSKNPGDDIAMAPRVRIGEGLTDDDFFHLTCHIDSNLKSKIERGEFVDLDKLLSKEKEGGFLFDGRNQYNNDTKLEWIHNEGGTFLVPAKRVSRINCYRRWEQAFRIFATIYCSKNPGRSREVWQYISVINSASLAFSWDNVYNYDIVFRQLMEFNPSRSWAVTYNQMWNLSMTNPLQSVNKGRNNTSGVVSTETVVATPLIFKICNNVKPNRTTVGVLIRV